MRGEGVQFSGTRVLVCDISAGSRRTLLKAKGSTAPVQQKPQIQVSTRPPLVYNSDRRLRHGGREGWNVRPPFLSTQVRLAAVPEQELDVLHLSSQKAALDHTWRDCGSACSSG